MKLSPVRILVVACVAFGSAVGLRAAETPDQIAVQGVLKAYKTALEQRDAAPAAKLFTPDSQVFESGGVEGTFADYLAHHIGPELGDFKEFSFRDYQADVRVDGPYAFASETYIYKIVLKDDRVIEKRGVATSILKKTGADWKIVQTHSSSRNLPQKK